MRAVFAEGSNHNLEDLEHRESKLDAVTCPISAADVNTMLVKASAQMQANAEGSTPDEDMTGEGTLRMREATAAAVNLIVLQEGCMRRKTTCSQKRVKAFGHIHDLKANSTPDIQKEKPIWKRAATVDIYRSEWKTAHASWLKQLRSDPEKQPYYQQWQVLNKVHERCLIEQGIESAGVDAIRRQEEAEEPLFRLIHGLPGSGKSQIIQWLRSYFEDVWHWEESIHFQFVAPLNSMAANIGGATLHSWGEIAWQDKHGRSVRSHGGAHLVWVMELTYNSMKN